MNKLIISMVVGLLVGIIDIAPIVAKKLDRFVRVIIQLI